MNTNAKLTVLLAGLSTLCLSSSSMAILLHDGSTDPGTEGWSQQGSFSATTGATNTTPPSWQISGAGNARGLYSLGQPITVSSGYVYTVRLRIDAAPTVSSDRSFWFGANEPTGGGDAYGWRVAFRDATTDQIAVGDPFSGGGNGQYVAFTNLPTNIVGDLQFHTFKVFHAESSDVTMYLDGTEILSFNVTSGTLLGSAVAGSVSMGTQNRISVEPFNAFWSNITFLAIPEPNTVVLLFAGCLLIGLGRSRLKQNK